MLAATRVGPGQNQVCDSKSRFPTWMSGAHILELSSVRLQVHINGKLESNSELRPEPRHFDMGLSILTGVLAVVPHIHLVQF